MSKPKIPEKIRTEQVALRNRILTIVAGVALLALAIYAGYRFNQPSDVDQAETVFPLGDEAVETESGLIYKELRIGEGPAAQVGDTVVIAFTGYTPDGQVFRSNIESRDYIEFVLGAGDVIPGWDEGILGMQAGGARLLVVHPRLAAGTIGDGLPLPENKTLTFSITLKEIK